MNHQFIQSVFFEWDKIPGRSYLQRIEAFQGIEELNFSNSVTFLSLAQNNLRGNGLYFFDELEAALSPQRQFTLMMEIYRCVKEGAQFFIVTHSPILLGVPARKYSALITAAFIPALMRKRTATRLQRCLSITERSCFADFWRSRLTEIPLKMRGI